MLEKLGKGLGTLLMLIVTGEGFVDLSCQNRVLMFWADDQRSGYFFITDGIVLGVGICFGAIHCIAWHLSFLTPMELLMW